MSTHQSENQCNTCIAFKVWDKPLPHDLAPYGCLDPRWAGYIHDPKSPPCGGLAYVRKPS